MPESMMKGRQGKFVHMTQSYNENIFVRGGEVDVDI
jgi:hypothetical protein